MLLNDLSAHSGLISSWQMPVLHAVSGRRKDGALLAQENSKGPIRKRRAFEAATPSRHTFHMIKAEPVWRK